MPTPRTVDRIMADQRAAAFTKRSIKTSAKEAGLRLAVSMVDLTTLEGKDSPEKVLSLCRKAITPDAAPHPSMPDLPSCGAVCVYPELVAVAKRGLAGSSVKVASVATGFPSGQYPLDVKLDDARRAIEAGADEIDMVINRGAFLAGDHTRVADEIAAVKEVCASASPPSPLGGEGQGEGINNPPHSGAPLPPPSPSSHPAPVHLKVILETGELETYDNVRAASDLAISAGLTEHDFIKTSTGKVNPAATMGVTLVMLEAIRDHYLQTGVRIGMKPAGGIRTAKQALHYLVMVKETLGDDWLTPDLFRIGASSLLNDLLAQVARLRDGTYAASYDFAEA